MKKTFSVSLPLVAEICTQVEAETEEEAIELAMEWFPGVTTLRDPTAKDDGAPHDMSWFVNEGSVHRHVVRGNVYCGCIREASAQEES